MKVIRVLPESGWTGVANTAARSRRISWRAKGLLLELLSYPESNDITIAKLAGWSAAARKEGYVAEGREALQMAMRELEREGYVVHVRRRDARKRWETTTYVSADPNALSQVAPSTGSPQSVDQYSVDQYSASQHSVDQYLSTQKTDKKTNNKTEEEEAGLQHTAALADARAGEDARASDELPPRLQRLYDIADKLSDDQLRFHLLSFERKRPQIYRNCRRSALTQMGKEPGGKQAMDSELGTRVIDLLSFKYALTHYADRLPEWLTRLPRA